MNDNPWRKVEDEIPDTTRDVLITDSNYLLMAVGYCLPEDGSWYIVGHGRPHTLTTIVEFWAEIPERKV